MRPSLPGVILAGGRSRRMGGGDKALMLLDHRAVLDHVVASLRPQVSALAINANGDPARFAGFGLPVIADSVLEHPGPLAGILAGLDWAAARFPEAVHLVTVAGDMPFLPDDLVRRLEAPRHAGLVCATSAGRLHPVAALWPLSIRPELHRALVDRGIRKVADFIGGHHSISVDFPVGEVDPFFNVNSPDDLATARRVIARIARA